jgi:uncharacterized Zn-finger protein
MHIHEEGKPFECPNCKKKFREKGNMKTHLKIHEKKKSSEKESCNFEVTIKSNFYIYKFNNY